MTDYKYDPTLHFEHMKYVDSIKIKMPRNKSYEGKYIDFPFTYGGKRLLGTRHLWYNKSDPLHQSILFQLSDQTQSADSSDYCNYCDKFFQIGDHRYWLPTNMIYASHESAQYYYFYPPHAVKICESCSQEPRSLLAKSCAK